MMDAGYLLRLFEACLTAPYRHVEEDGRFYVMRENDRVTVFFEKSNGIEDWRNNFRFSARPYGEMRDVWLCHRGFMRVFRALLSYLEEIFLDESVRHFRFVGYSHGAALAFLAHEYVTFHRPDMIDAVEGYGFGCPRVVAGYISPEFKKRMAGFTVVKNLDDLVTHLPPRIFGYRHVKKPYVIGKRGEYSMIDAHRDTSYRRELLRLAYHEEKKEDACDTGRNGSCSCRK